MTAVKAEGKSSRSDGAPAKSAAGGAPAKGAKQKKRRCRKQKWLVPKPKPPVEANGHYPGWDPKRCQELYWVWVVFPGSPHEKKEYLFYLRRKLAESGTIPEAGDTVKCFIRKKDESGHTVYETSPTRATVVRVKKKDMDYDDFKYLVDHRCIIRPVTAIARIVRKLGSARLFA